MIITIVGSGNIAHALVSCMNINSEDKIRVMTT
jgi:hypothetical protein